MGLGYAPTVTLPQNALNATTTSGVTAEPPMARPPPGDPLPIIYTYITPFRVILYILDP